VGVSGTDGKGKDINSGDTINAPIIGKKMRKAPKGIHGHQQKKCALGNHTAFVIVVGLFGKELFDQGYCQRLITVCDSQYMQLKYLTLFMPVYFLTIN
jgi:hypothetical protein